MREGEHRPAGPILLPSPVSQSVQTLDRIGRWLGSEGITGLLNPTSPTQQLWTTFRAAQNRIPRKEFLARWYPPTDAPNGAFTKANLRLEQFDKPLTFFSGRTVFYWN